MMIKYCLNPFALANLCWFAVLLSSAPASAQTLALRNAKVYTSANSPAVENATIIIEDGLIKGVGRNNSVTIPAHCKTYDLQGNVVMAGFWNSHVHFIEAKWSNASSQPRDTLEKYLREMLSSKGFVFAFDLAELDFNNINNLRRRIGSGEITSPTILSVGVPFTSRSPFYIKPAVLPEIATSAAVQKHIEQQIKEGANGIKLWSASPTGPGISYMSDSLIRTASRITKQEGIPLFAHPTDNSGVIMAIRNGVNVLAHTSPDNNEKWDSAFVNTMIREDVALIPTLKLFAWELKRSGIDPTTHPLVTTAVNQLAVFFNAGGNVIFGTDVGYMADYDPSDEYVLMAEAGMTFRDILAALTENPARIFGHKNTGAIAVGMAADLVILKSDPAEDVRNFTSVIYTIHKGRIIYLNMTSE